MNIFEKIQKARIKLQSSELKKTGYNKHSNFYYFELADFLPKVNEIFDELKLFSNFSIDQETATLKIVNNEKPDEVETFTSNVVDATNNLVKGIQALGSTHTYLKRYLYVNALEIIEPDTVDPFVGKKADDNRNHDNSGTDKTAKRKAQEKFIKTNEDKFTKMITACLNKYGKQVFQDLSDEELEKLKTAISDEINKGKGE